MADLTPDDVGFGDTYVERPEASESGIITELEHRRSRIMSTDDEDDDEEDEDFTGEPSSDVDKKGRGRRLSSRVARNIKKQFKTDKRRPRSLSPPRSSPQQKSRANTSPELRRNQTLDVALQPPQSSHLDITNIKKPISSKFKPVAKAAVSAAKKLGIKPASSSKNKDEDNSACSSRASTPTDLAGPGSLPGGKTPVNTPVNATTSVVDRSTIESVLQQLPPTLKEVAGEEADEEEESLKELPAKPHPQGPPPTGDTTAAAAAPASAVPTEDEALKLAEAMALAVQSNPTKSQDEIRRMVYSQPEFKHLAPPGAIKATSTQSSSSSSGDYTTKLLKKNFNNIKKQFTSGAGTAQKKILEMADPFGAGISALSFGIGGATSAKDKSAGTTAKTTSAASSEKSLDAESSISSGLSAAAVPSVSTIPEDSQVSLEKSTETPPAATPTTEAAATKEDSAVSAEDSKPAATEPKRWQDLPITITDIVWKRRSGFGKYSADAWERRRFVLQGNVLSYYRAKQDSLEPMDDETERMDLNASTANLGTKATKYRMFDYMEQVAVSAGLTTATVTDKSEEEKKSSARGYMDLIKENAVICATLGHSGAPSPFCLSIKVSGETKWKLCFSSHRSQLQWMAAISDVIVRASVDMYNIKLLTKADPANHDPTQAFQPHVYEPPNDEQQQPSSEKSVQSQQLKREVTGEDEELMPQPSLQVSGKRLWMLEPYVIRPKDDDDDEDGSFCSSSSVEEEGQETKPVGVDPIDDRDIWFLPEKNLLLAAIIINAAILYARNSNMSVHSFWTVITVANIALFAFLESQPRPETVAAALAQAAPRQSPKKRKRKKRSATMGRPGTDIALTKGKGAAVAKAKKEPFKPTAGTSSLRVEKPDDPNTNAKGETFSRWCAVGGESLQIRSHGYGKTKAKCPSPGTLYDLAQFDIFEAPARYPDMAPRVKLPKLPYDIDPNEQKTWKAPDHFVVSFSLPTDPPKLGASTTDGGGYIVTMYFTLRKSTRDILKRVTADGYDPSSEEKPEDIQKWQVNAVRVFEEWCRRGTSDITYLTRFKMVPNVVNAEEIGLPSWIGKYNGKPLLIKRPGQTGFFLPHPELSCIEFDISLHVFPYLAKQGLCYLKDTMFKNLIATVGFVIEGRDDDELPECLIGVVQICYPDPANIMQASDFFAGTAPRSFEPEDESSPAKAQAKTPTPAAVPVPIVGQ